MTLAFFLAWTAILLTGFVFMGLWVVTLSKAMKRLETILVTNRAIPRPPDHGAFDFVPERSPIDSKATIEFWRGVHESTWWAALAHMLQVETRTRLMAARSFAADGKDAACAFETGAAWYASQLVVRPQAETNAAISRLRQEQEAKALEQMTQADHARPGKF